MSKEDKEKVALRQRRRRRKLADRGLCQLTVTIPISFSDELKKIIAEKIKEHNQKENEDDN